VILLKFLASIFLYYLQYKPCGVWALYEPGKRYSVLRDILVSETGKKWLEKKK